jgi:hypothetical protein
MATLDPSIWVRSVPLVADGDPVKASVTNAPTIVLSDRTAALKALFDSIEKSQQLLLRDAPIDTDVEEGHVVFFESATFVHNTALALYRSLETVNGRIEPAEKAIATGVVINKTSANSGDILMAGVATLSTAALTILFDSVVPTQQRYFLSALVAGTVQADAPPLKIPIVQYLGNNTIRVFQPDFEPLTHDHRIYTLYPADWLGSGSFDPEIVPAGALFGYDLTSLSATSQSLSEILLPAIGEVEMVYDPAGPCAEAGLHVDPDLFIVDENGIWWLGASVSTCELRAYATVADVQGLAVLHSIQSLTPDNIEIINANGRVTVNFKEFVDNTGNAGSEVVKDIQGNELVKGLVVEQLLAGLGIVLTPSGGQGQVTVGLIEQQDLLLPARLLNLNNSVTGVDSPYVFTDFPEDREALVSCEVTLPNFADPSLYQARIYAQFLGPDGGQAGPLIEDIVKLATPSTSGATPVTEPDTTFPAFPGVTVSTDVYLVLSTAAFSLTGFNRGSILYTLRADNPSPRLRMITTGVLLELI